MFALTFMNFLIIKDNCHDASLVLKSDIVTFDKHATVLINTNRTID